MMFVAILITILVSSCILFHLLPIEKAVIDEEIVGGFMFFIILISIISLMIPASTPVNGHQVGIFVIIGITVTFLTRFKASTNSIKNILFSTQTLALVVLCLLYFGIGATSIRFHSSPDNYGFASAVGFFRDNFSFNYLKQYYMAQTGLNKAVFMGQPCPLFDSVWQIPDQQLRFIGDMVLCVGRIGLPLLGALLGSFFEPIASFNYFMIIVGLIGIWACAILMLRTAKLVAQLVSGDNHLFENISHSRSTLFTGIIIFALAPWATIYVLEGTLTQLWLLVACLWQMKLLLSVAVADSSRKRNFLRDMLSFSLAPIFLSLVYANGIPLFLLACSFPGFIIFIENIFRKKRWIPVLPAFIGTLAFIPGSYLLLSGAFMRLVHMILNSISGVPYNLAVSRLTDLLPLVGNRFQFISPTLPGTGFDPLSNDIHAALLILWSNVILIGLILMMSCFKPRGLFTKFLLLGLPLTLLLMPIAMLLHPVKFHPYIYARYLVNYITLGFPILIGVIISNDKLRSFFSPFLARAQTFILINLSILAVFNFCYMTVNFKNVTKRLNIIQDAKTFLDLQPDNSVFVTNKPDQRVTSLTLLGKMYYLTDNWTPVFLPQQVKPETKNVYFIDVDVYPATFKKLGILTIAEKIKGPINAQEIVKLRNFSPSE